MSTYQVYRFRFAVLLSYCLVNASNAIQWISFAAITSLTGTYFNVSASMVNGLSICFFALYLPGTIMATWLFTKYSMRTGFLVGAAMTAVGGWIRYGATFGDTTTTAAYAGLLFGQCVSALAQPVFTNLPAKVASRWFPTSERDKATVVGAIFNPIGNAIGELLSSSFVVQNGTDPTVQGMSDWMLFQAIVATISLLIGVLLFRDRPKTPASPSQESTVFSEKGPNSFRTALNTTLRECMECFKEPSFIWLFLAFSLGLGLFNGVSTVIQQITTPICATSDDASLFGGLLIGIGLVGAIIFGVILDRTHRYISALRIGYVGAMLFCVILTLVMRTGMLDAVSGMFAMIGFFMLPMLPVSLQAAAEVTYPIPEDVSSGLLMTGGQIVGIAMVFSFDATISTFACNPDFIYPGSSIIIICTMVASCLCIFMYRGQSRRLKIDEASLINYDHI